MCARAQLSFQLKVIAAKNMEVRNVFLIYIIFPAYFEERANTQAKQMEEIECGLKVFGAATPGMSIGHQPAAAN